MHEYARSCKQEFSVRGLSERIKPGPRGSDPLERELGIYVATEVGGHTSPYFTRARVPGLDAQHISA